MTSFPIGSQLRQESDKIVLSLAYYQFRVQNHMQQKTTKLNNQANQVGFMAEINDFHMGIQLR